MTMNQSVAVKLPAPRVSGKGNKLDREGRRGEYEHIKGDGSISHDKTAARFTEKHPQQQSCAH